MKVYSVVSTRGLLLLKEMEIVHFWGGQQDLLDYS